MFFVGRDNIWIVQIEKQHGSNPRAPSRRPLGPAVLHCFGNRCAHESGLPASDRTQKWAETPPRFAWARTFSQACTQSRARRRKARGGDGRTLGGRPRFAWPLQRRPLFGAPAPTHPTVGSPASCTQTPERYQHPPWASQIPSTASDCDSHRDSHHDSHHDS